MKTKSMMFVLAVLAFFLAFTTMTSVALCQDQESEVTIEGTVIATEWDEDDNVVSVAISVTIFPEDSTEEEYVIDYLVTENAKGNELVNFVGQDVRATGTVVEDEDGVFIISVRVFEVIKEE